MAKAIRIWFSGFKATRDPGGRTVEALDIVERWRIERARPRHLINAILLYASLLRGDTSELRKQFPLLNLDAPNRARVEALDIVIEDSGFEGSLDEYLESMGYE